MAFVLQGKPHYVEEDDKVINTKVCIVNLTIWIAFWYLSRVSFQEFRGMALQSHGPQQQAGRPWIGLEHTNKVKIPPKHLLLSISYFYRLTRGRGTPTWRSRSKSTIEPYALPYLWTPQVWQQIELKQVNHSDLKSGEKFKLGEQENAPPCHSQWDFGLFKVHFPALEQHRREVYLLIYIDILISLHRFGADIHISYSRLAQIIPVNENLTVFPCHPSGFWTGEEICLQTRTIFDRFDIDGLIRSIYLCNCRQTIKLC